MYYKPQLTSFQFISIRRPFSTKLPARQSQPVSLGIFFPLPSILQTWVLRYLGTLKLLRRVRKRRNRKERSAKRQFTFPEGSLPTDKRGGVDIEKKSNSVINSCDSEMWNYFPQCTLLEPMRRRPCADRTFSQFKRCARFKKIFRILIFIIQC